MSADAVEVFPGEASGFARGCEPLPSPLPERARWCVARGDAVVLVSAPEGERLPSSLTELGLSPATVHHLGSLDGEPLFGVELPNGHPLPEGASVVGLRALAERVDPSTWAAASFGAQVIYWDCTTRHCGICGGPTSQRDPRERAKHCPRCDHSVWPRVSPCVIVRVTDDAGRLLLVRQPSWSPGRYSLVAGFVEAGETLEQCVRRELREETGVEVTDIAYVASQPWPFPHQLMVGFSARYASGEVRPTDPEIDAAGWFAPDALPELPPSGISIARRMIEGYLLQRNR